MAKPKQQYPRAIAQKLRPQSCPDCGSTSRRRIRELPDLEREVNPGVLVSWHCPDTLCEQSDGFWIESR
ncbi:hypothetical protein [Streptomyces sp. NPDC002889]|uniref:hypothetical protein n=1 Tax=Streptomyces sp. NPDC002889 TaxID=3364669 RepID=UPI00368D32F3